MPTGLAFMLGRNVYDEVRVGRFSEGSIVWPMPSFLKKHL